MIHQLCTCALALFVVGTISTWSTSVVAQQASERTDDERAGDWIIGALAASELIKSSEPGAVLVLDARTDAQFRKAHVPGSQHVDWKTFSQRKAPRKGRLLPQPELQKRLRAVGVRRDVRVVVVGDPAGWGEDGRIVWMLRAAGHPTAALVDGGFDVLVAAHVPMTEKVVPPTAGDFVVKWDPSLTATSTQVAAAQDGKVVVDVRTEGEFDGATPYGESRGGHVPGAQSIYYKDLMNPDGTVRSREDVAALLGEHGVTKSSDIVLYCTGGVRSAWALVALKHYGYDDVQNYAGSMWEWSAADPATHPLVKPAPAAAAE